MQKIPFKNLKYSYNYFLTILIITSVVLPMLIYIGYINPVEMIEGWIIVFGLVVSGYLLFFSITAIFGLQRQIKKGPPEDEEVLEEEEIDEEAIKKVKNIISNAESKAILFILLALTIVVFNLSSLLLAAYIAAITAVLAIVYSFSFYFYWLFIKTCVPGIENQSETMKGENNE